MTVTIDFDELAGMAGRDLGFSEYIDVTQDRIDLFADATGDHQYIHVDPERAKLGPFGATIAHGFLTLALSVPLMAEVMNVEGAGTKINYGLDRVRFVSPVKVGSRIRIGAVIAEVDAVGDGYQLAIDETIEIEGSTKPAMVARALSRFYR